MVLRGVKRRGGLTRGGRGSVTVYLLSTYSKISPPYPSALHSSTQPLPTPYRINYTSPIRQPDRPFGFLPIGGRTVSR